MNLDLPELPKGWRWRIDRIDDNLCVFLDKLHERRFFGPKWKSYAIRYVDRSKGREYYYNDARYEAMTLENKIKNRAEDMWERRKSYLRGLDAERQKKEKEDSIVGVYGESEAL